MFSSFFYKKLAEGPTQPSASFPIFAFVYVFFCVCMLEELPLTCSPPTTLVPMYITYRLLSQLQQVFDASSVVLLTFFLLIIQTTGMMSFHKYNVYLLK